MNGEHLITLDRLLDLHRRSIARFNTAPLNIGQSHRDCAEGKIGNAWAAESYFDQPSTRHGLCFAGFLMFYLVKGHCFPDGNKRIGWLAAMTVLASLGLTVNATDEEAIGLVHGISTGSVSDGHEVVRWLADKLESPED